MDVWDKDFLDLVETAHLTFKDAADGEIAFGALKGFLDVRYGTRDGSACAEFSWEGNDENDPASGRGWAQQAASSDTSKSTTATIQASYAIAPDFFNGLLGLVPSEASAAYPMCQRRRRFVRSAKSARACTVPS